MMAGSMTYAVKWSFLVPSQTYFSLNSQSDAFPVFYMVTVPSLGPSNITTENDC